MVGLGVLQDVGLFRRTVQVFLDKVIRWVARTGERRNMHAGRALGALRAGKGDEKLRQTRHHQTRSHQSRNHLTQIHQT